MDWTFKTFVLLVGLVCNIHGHSVRMREDKSCSLYLGFDRYNGAQLFDDSTRNNKATLENGATITKTDGSCGMCVQLTNGEVVFNGKDFKGLPKEGITIALMIYLDNTIGSHEIFQTVGDHSEHNEGQYHLEIIDGKIRWFHRNEKGETVFSVETVQGVIKQKTWYEVGVTYSSEGVSRIFCNGDLLKEEISDKMTLSQDWGAFAGIGNFKGDRELKGYLDEFYIFNRTLNATEIQDIHEHCKGLKSAKVMAMSFESIKGNVTYDQCYQGNDGYFTGEFIKGNNGTCGNDVGLPSSTEQNLNVMSVRGSKFRNKPTDACTILMWTKLEDNKGVHKLFYTTGGHSMHTHEQYDLSVHDGALHWIHRNEYDQQIFNVHTEPIVVKGEWTHIAATYNSTKQIAVIYVNGEIKEGKNGVGALSEDWDGIAAFGQHGVSSSGIKTLDYFDEIEMYDRELSPLEIRQIFMKCSDVLVYGMRSTIPSKRITRPTFVRVKRDLEHQAQLVYMTFDRIAGDKVFDDSGYGNVGHLIGMAKLARDVGKCGHGLRFQGGNLLLNGHLMKNIPKKGITIALWVYMDTVAGQQEIFQTIDPKALVNKHGMYYLEADDGHMRWFHRNEKSETIFSIETKEKIIQPEVWIHIGVTYDVESKKACLYANGHLIQSDEGTGALSGDWEGRVSIGKFYDTAENGDYLEGRSFQGILDELFIYNRALSQIEISRLSQICDFRRVDLYYTFDNIKGDKLYDQSGLANFGKITKTLDTVPGYCGNALNFTSESYIELSGDEFRQKPANAISIAVWIRLNTNRDRHQLFNTIGSRSLHKHDQYDFSVINGQIKWFHRDHLGKTVFDIDTFAVVKPRQWVHLIATYDSQENKAQVYLDGHLVKEIDGTGYLSQDWGHFAGIGKHYYENRYFSGAIDELMMFNYALPFDEVGYVYKKQCAVK